jgi:hypothetical protein
MINGRISVQGANYQLLDGEGRKPDGDTIRLKILQVRDNDSGLEICLPFSVEEFEQFVAAMQSGISKIIPAGGPLPRIADFPG